VSAVAFSILVVMALALAGYLAALELRIRARRSSRGLSSRKPLPPHPGSERRAEQRSRSLPKSVVNREEWEMYRDLGFIRVTGRPGSGRDRSGGYCYLIYPHRPIVAYLPESNSLLSEYCVEFLDLGESPCGAKLPDSDDVLAKWMMINADEKGLIHSANMHLPGRQIDPQQVRRDLWGLAEWERGRPASRARAA
jgi:hypothetical protein